MKLGTRDLPKQMTEENPQDILANTINKEILVNASCTNMATII